MKVEDHVSRIHDIRWEDDPIRTDEDERPPFAIVTRLRRKAAKDFGATDFHIGRWLRAKEYMHRVGFGEVLAVDSEHLGSVRVGFRQYRP